LSNFRTDIYFEKAHKMLPFIHRARFKAGLHLPPNLGVPVPLRYAVWTLGAASSNDMDIRSYKDVMYSRARRTLNDHLDVALDAMRPHNISTLQALILLTTYEFLHANFGHAWMNCGRAARMSVYFNLMRLDEPHLFCKQTLNDPKDWIEQEERRRTLWAAFMLDRFASLGTGWAPSFNEADITTFLPGPDDEYQAGVVTRLVRANLDWDYRREYWGDLICLHKTEL
jgi:Fungal specific transcription factor domain